ncbi:MAG: type III pantothenate kinase [Sphingobacteriaceae bacterium]
MVLDIGNSYTKIAFFEQNEMIEYKRLRVPNSNYLSKAIRKHQPKTAIVSTVTNLNPLLVDFLSKETKLIKFGAGTIKSIKNHYRTPETLGLDRLAGIAGSRHLYPQTGNLVIDAGTCITYDFVDTDGNYFGGSISPGIMMRYQALKHYTKRLPLLKPDKDFDLHSGRDTAESILSGVQNGVTYEVAGFIKNYADRHPEMNIILTGGDWIFFDTQLKNSIFAPYLKIEPYLVLKGLNAVILQHND